MKFKKERLFLQQHYQGLLLLCLSRSTWMMIAACLLGARWSKQGISAASLQ